jgi:hypothetical protein
LSTSRTRRSWQSCMTIWRRRRRCRCGLIKWQWCWCQVVI